MIDAHAHIYECLKPYGPRGEGRAIGKGRLRWANGEIERFFPEKYGDYEFSAENLLGIMEENHIDNAVLLQAQNYGFHNEYVSEAVKKYPNKFVGACTIDPYAVKAMELFDYFTTTLGLKILKLEISENWGLAGIHPDLNLDADIFNPIWEMAQERNIVLVIDTGTRDTKSWRVDHVIRLMKKYPNLKIVICHLFFPGNDGFNEKRLEMIRAVSGENTFFDISSVVNNSEVYPFFEKQRYIREVANIVGAEHMMWGTDLPYSILHIPYKQLTGYLFDGGLFSDTELKKITDSTARHVYHII